MKRLFFCFSAADKWPGRDFVVRLFERLQQQHIDPRVCEPPGGTVATVASRADGCRRLIEESDIVVVFIDDRALRSREVNMEVSHALWESRRRLLPIVPLVATETLMEDWPVALAEATGFTGIFLPPRPVDALERVVAHVCECLGVAYVPENPGAPRSMAPP
jgi:hypothetical protein